MSVVTFKIKIITMYRYSCSLCVCAKENGHVSIYLFILLLFYYTRAHMHACTHAHTVLSYLIAVTEMITQATKWQRE